MVVVMVMMLVVLVMLVRLTVATVAMVGMVFLRRMIRLPSHMFLEIRIVSAMGTGN